MNELRALACLVQHKAHVIHWKDSLGWIESRCIFCHSTPQVLEKQLSYPFINVSAKCCTVIYSKLKKPRLLKDGHTQNFYWRQFTHVYLERFGLTWPQVRDAK